MTTSDSIPQPTARENPTLTQKLGKLADAVLLVSVLVLAVTGIGTFVLGRAPMSGWVLMIHVSVTGLFALGLAWVGLAWAGESQPGSGSASGRNVGARILCWVILTSGLVAILSGVVPMTPLFGTDGQHGLYLVHRYSTILFTAALLWHRLTRKKERASP